ncbi:MAG: hypothetical protein JXA58_05695, partial [Dehalococcoidia bacterium]|nr:hypothetical protein [Dehalococcoidia bacterium]
GSKSPPFAISSFMSRGAAAEGGSTLHIFSPSSQEPPSAHQHADMVVHGTGPSRHFNSPDFTIPQAMTDSFLTGATPLQS